MTKVVVHNATAVVTEDSSESRVSPKTLKIQDPYQPWNDQWIPLPNARLSALPGEPITMSVALVASCDHLCIIIDNNM